MTVEGALAPAPHRQALGFCPRSSPLRWGLAVVGLLSVGVDLWLCQRGEFSSLTRAKIALLAAAIYLWPGGMSLSAVGLTLRPKQSWRHWIRLTLKIGFGIAAAVGIFIVGSLLLGKPIEIYSFPVEEAPSQFVHMCLSAPLIEEPLYRFALCVPLVGTFGRVGTILSSGAIFALLHGVYGNLSPDNFVAGYFLGWAFLHSGTLLIPLALHALGNFVAFGTQLALGYWGA